MSPTRTTSYGKRMLERAGEPILDIPDLAILAFRGAEELIHDFETTWNVRPQAVVIPVLSADGVNFENPVKLPVSRMCDQRLRKAEGGAVDFGKSVYAFAKLGCDIYLSIAPSISFVSANPLFLVDSVGDTAHQTCISKDGMREMLSEVLAEGAILAAKAVKSLAGDGKNDAEGPQVRGIVFDLVNIWPMGATEGRMELTCFCETCKARIEQFMTADYDPPELLSHFRDFPSPANLLLTDSGTGISYIESFTSSTNAAAVVGLCKMKGYDRAWTASDDSQLTRSAQYLMSFLRARHRLTVEAVQAIMNSTTQILADEGLGESVSSLQSIFLLEGDPYDWTAGLFLDALDESAAPGGSAACDELWFDPTSGTPAVHHLATRSYMWRRSRYMIDALFDSIASISSETIRAVTGWARYGLEDVERMLDSRKRATLGARMEGLAALQGLRPEEANRVGFVGVGLSEVAVDLLIRAAPIAKGRTDVP